MTILLPVFLQLLKISRLIHLRSAGGVKNLEGEYQELLGEFCACFPTGRQQKLRA